MQARQNQLPKQENEDSSFTWWTTPSAAPKLPQAPHYFHGMENTSLQTECIQNLQR